MILPTKKKSIEYQTAKAEPSYCLDKCFNTVNLYAANRVQPPVAVLYRIADILEVDVRELLQPSLRKSN